MEESCEVYSDDNNALPEKKQKRKVKTPAQVEALEKLYDEHKYPTDSMRLQLAESSGLTEKQVSGWFCHRRLKDKRLKNDTCAQGKQDRSSGVIQDSCGSTKQGEYKHSDPREVESRRFIGEEFPGVDNKYELGNHYIQNHNGTDDDTSSGSRSPLQESYFPQSMDPLVVVTSRKIMGKGNTVPMGVKGSQGRTGPSGYLKVKAKVEHTAITSVKRQLGRNYIEDGPPLGVDFEPLPPGAFESPARDPVDEPGFVGEPNLLHSSYGSRACKQPHPGTGYEEYSSKMGLHNSDLDGKSFQTNNRENYSHIEFEKKPSLSYHRKPAHKHVSSMEMNEEDSAGEAPVQDNVDSYGMRTKHESVYGKKLGGKQMEPWSSSRGDASAKIPHRERFESSPPNYPVKRNKFHPLEERGLSRRTTKEGDIYGERRGVDDYHDPVNVNAHPVNGIRLTERFRGDFPQQQYTMKAAMGEMTPWTNLSRRSLTDVPSSFSEDETGETSSSAD